MALLDFDAKKNPTKAYAGMLGLAASDDATLGLLHETRGALPASLRESGLELTNLQIGPLAAPDAGHAPKAADGA